MTSGSRPPVARRTELAQQLEIEAASVTLVSQRRIGKPIANDDSSRRQRRPNDFVDVLRARRVHQKRLGQGLDRRTAIQEDAADRIAELGAARLPRDRYANFLRAAVAQPNPRRACFSRCLRSLQRRRTMGVRRQLGIRAVAAVSECAAEPWMVGAAHEVKRRDERDARSERPQQRHVSQADAD